MYLITCKADGYIEAKNENKCLILASTDKSKEVFKQYAQLYNEIKYPIKTINGVEPGEYEKDFMKIKFNSDDDDFPLNEILKLHNLT